MFSIFFLLLVVMGSIILETESRIPYTELTAVDFILLTLASFRLTHLFVYDAVTKWFREQFYIAKVTKTAVTLHKPPYGPRRTIADFLSCPWGFGMWAAAMVIFFYLLTPLAFFPILLLAISGVTSFLQVFANFIGHRAEQLKRSIDLD